MPCSSVKALVAVVVLALALPVGGGHADTTPSDPQRLAAARDLMAVTGVDRQIDGMIQVMGAGLSHGAAQSGNPAAGKMLAQSFDVFIERFKSYRAPMLDEIAALYAARFSTEELTAVADFYRAGAGAKFIAVMPELMQQGSQIGLKYSQKVLEDLKAAPSSR